MSAGPHAWPPRSLLAIVDEIVDRMDEAGVTTPVLVVALAISVAVLWCLTRGTAHAAELGDGPTPSDLAGIILMLLPCVVSVLFVACAFRPAPASWVDEEAYGDTTGFGERQR